MRCHAPPKSFDTPRNSPLNLCKLVKNFTKLTLQGSSTTLDLQDLKISGQDAKPRPSMRHQKVRWSPASFHAPTQTPYALSRAQRAKRWHVPFAHDVMDDVILHYPDWPGPTWKSNPAQTACKKKKKKEKEKEKKSFDQVELWLWLKSQNFEKWPVPLSFSSTFQFWDPFLHLKFRNCANTPIPKKLTFAQILTKKSKFSRSTCLAQFFV